MFLYANDLEKWKYQYVIKKARKGSSKTSEGSKGLYQALK